LLLRWNIWPARVVKPKIIPDRKHRSSSYRTKKRSWIQTLVHGEFNAPPGKRYSLNFTVQLGESRRRESRLFLFSVWSSSTPAGSLLLTKWTKWKTALIGRDQWAMEKRDHTGKDVEKIDTVVATNSPYSIITWSYAEGALNLQRREVLLIH
jgi:hypothetical protein